MEKDNKLIEIRWHGRGGQGAVTASELLAEAALEEGMFFQAFPDYGPERMGAPIRAYTRISSSRIYQHCQITEPDVVLVLDPTLIKVVDVTQGLKEDGILLVNTAMSPQQLRQSLNNINRKAYTIDASGIALETIGRSIPNIPMIGALLKIIPLLSKESVIGAIRKRLGAKLGKNAAEANIKALERAYQQVRSE